MGTLTRKTNAADVIKHMDLNVKTFDFTPSNGIRHYTLELVNSFEKEYLNSLPQRQKELLFSGLRYYRRISESFTSVKEFKSVDDNYEVNEIELIIHHKSIFCNRIYSAFIQGFNPTLFHFQENILTLITDEVASASGFRCGFSWEYNCKPIYDKKGEQVDCEELPPITVAKFASLIMDTIKKEIAHVVSTVEMIKYLEQIASDLNEVYGYDTQLPLKLKWTGTPSQFGFIMDLLIQGGYLEKPATSKTKMAEYFSEHFDINTTLGSLAKELSESTNSVSTTNRNSIIIPHKDNLR